MDERRAVNRSMFWRVIRRMVFANTGRLFVILLALGAGSAVTAALLNLQVDAKKRIGAEFRTFGPNIVISPRVDATHHTLSEEIEKEILPMALGAHVGPFLYLSGEVAGDNAARIPVVVVGMLPFAFDLLEPNWRIEPKSGPETAGAQAETCIVGVLLASKLRLTYGHNARVSVGNQEFSCRVMRTLSSGGEEDNQIFVDLHAAQSLGSAPGQVSLIQLSVPGTSEQVQKVVLVLQDKFPDTEVHPIRQFTEGEARLYGKISGVLTATVVVVLVLTALCVMAAMTNIAAERKNDVGLMKAIGGSVRRVLRIFLAEAALLGLVAGLVGAAGGILLSIGLGKAVFGVAAQPRLVVYPVSVVLTVIVAVLAAYPLRRLANIRPASVFRGEE